MKGEVIPEAFKEFDKNNDGVIDAAELKLVLKGLGQEVTDETVEEMIREVDVNGDGNIDYKEFIRVARSRSAIGSALRETAIPEVSRKIYQRAALGGLISLGQEVPRDWLPGEQYAISADNEFETDEMVVVVMSDGNLKFGKINSCAAGGDSFSIAIAESKLGIKYVQSAAAKVGKILALSQNQIQRLGSSKLTSTGAEAAGVTKGGLLSSIRDMVDIDKTSLRDDTLPFQPMLSRRASSPPPSMLTRAPKLGGDVVGGEKTVGRDSGEWGDLEGWWRDQDDGSLRESRGCTHRADQGDADRGQQAAEAEGAVRGQASCSTGRRMKPTQFDLFMERLGPEREIGRNLARQFGVEAFWRAGSMARGSAAIWEVWSEHFKFDVTKPFSTPDVFDI